MGQVLIYIAVGLLLAYLLSFRRLGWNEENDGHDD
jgi:hypothetical protein